jgi:SAM-dependent methyltransferase
MEPVEYDRMASVEERHWWWRGRRDILARVVGEFAPPESAGDRRIVEVGCGSGGSLEMLSRFGSVLGAEHDGSALEHLRAKHGGARPAIQHTIPDPLPNRYHVLAMFDVLEHLDDDREAMDWAARHVLPGGIVVITVPAFQFLWTEQDEALHHKRRYTPAQLRHVVPPSLEVVHTTAFNSLLFPPIFAARQAMALRRRGDQPRSHVGLPPEPLNWLLYRVFRAERHWVTRFSLPIGVSLLLVARRLG